jgi:ABC-type transport system involved in cytochrome c biogenesis permease subunit
MSLTLLRLTAAVYAAAAAGYLLYFARPRYAWAARAGAWLLAAAFLVHMVAIGFGCKEYGGLEWFTLRGGFVMTAGLIAGAYLLLQRFYHLPTVGAFVTPLVLLFLLPTLFGEGGAPGVAPETLRYPTVTLHIMSASLGVALFAIAFLAALMYLLQEREVKGKRFGALFSRLPSLQSLDALEGRVVRLGFLVFTVALLSGAVTARGVWKSAWSWDPQQVSSLVVWALYGLMVQLRHSGWHGRRFAVLAVLGFVLVMGSRLSLRVIPGATRHAGSYSADQREGVR